MRHQRNSRRFGRSPSHRKAMFDNLVTSLFIHERILTTVDRAKELRRVAEKLITLGKRNDLHARRLAARRLRTTGQRIEDAKGKATVQKEVALEKLFESIAPRFKDRPGGYTRIIRTGNRQGDNAQMAFIEILPEEKKPARKGKKKTATPAKKQSGAAKTAEKAASPAKKRPSAAKTAEKATPKSEE